MAQPFIALFIVATLVEGIVEYFFAKEDKAQPWLKYAAAVIASVICVSYNLDILGLLGMVSPIPYVGNLLTGLVVGRGSNYLNDFISSVGEPKFIINDTEPTVNPSNSGGGGGFPNVSVARPTFVSKD